MTENCQPGKDAAQEKASSLEVDGIGKSKAGNSEHQSFLRGAISAFILFNLIAITCWAIPSNLSLVKDVRELARPYMLWTGLFQSWNFFAPNPKSTNSYIEAVAITRNRHQKVWVFPRMEQLSYGERYRKERYRKFAEVLTEPKNADLWPDVAEHLVRMFNSPTDPPEVVLLIQFQAPIKPGAHRASDLVPKPNIFYEYENNFQPEDRQ